MKLRKEEGFPIEKELNTFLKDIEHETKIRFIEEKVTLSNFFNNRMLMVYAIRKGIPYCLFHEFRELMPFSEADWANFLGLSTKSLQRFKKDEDFVFKPIHSEKILELAEVTFMGNEIFDTEEQFYFWLNSPSLALGNMKPIELLNDSFGKELVVAELNRIDYGIFV